MVNQWIQHVKQYANQHGCSYSDALKRAKSSYQSSSKPRRKSKGKGMINYDDIRGQPIMITGDYRGPNDPRKAYMKGRGNFWEDIKPATKYLQPVGDAMMKKAIEKINGLGVKKKMKGRGNFWDDIQPATTYLRPVGDALIDKSVEKIRGSGNFWEDIKPATKYLQPVGDAMMKKAIEKINGLGVKKMRGRGNFWEDIKPATKYLQPVGDAMMKKAIEKIQGLGLKKRVHRKKRGGALYAAGYGVPM